MHSSRRWYWALIALYIVVSLLCAGVFALDVQTGDWAHGFFVGCAGMLAAWMLAFSAYDLRFHEHACEQCGGLWDCQARDCASARLVPICPSCSAQTSFPEIVRAMPPGVWA